LNTPELATPHYAAEKEGFLKKKLEISLFIIKILDFLFIVNMFDV
jgi:hypothetical protein